MWGLFVLRHARAGGFHLLAQLLPLPFHVGGGDIFLAELVEVAHGLVCSLLGLQKDGVGFLVGFPQDALPLFFQFLLSFLCLFFQTLQFPPVGGDFVLLFLNGAPAYFQVGEKVFEGFVLFA